MALNQSCNNDNLKVTDQVHENVKEKKIKNSKYTMFWADLLIS